MNTISRLAHCRYYDGENEPTLGDVFEEYYFAMAEKFYVNGGCEGEDNQYFLDTVRALPLDLPDDVPMELVAQLYMTCEHILQKGSLELCPPEHVAEYFRTKYFPKYLSGRK